MKIKPAKGTRGYLLRVAAEGQLVFRVYDEHDKRLFTDYDIRHYDMEVLITDDSASFYSGMHGNQIDYSPESLMPDENSSSE